MFIWLTNERFESMHKRNFDLNKKITVFVILSDYDISDVSNVKGGSSKSVEFTNLEGSLF